MAFGIYSASELEEFARECATTILRWLRQVMVLCWKELLRAYRYPFYSLAQILAPAIIIGILGYGADISPKIPVPGYRYKGPSEIVTESFPPSTNPYVGDATNLFYELSNGSAALTDALSSEYFINQTVPAYINALNDPRVRDPAFTVVNIPAASPFLVPSLKSYLEQRNLERQRVGALGIKSYGNTNDYIWHLFQPGRLIFSPNSPLVDELVNYLLNTSGPILKDVILPFVPNAFETKSGFGFPNTGSINLQEAWAIIEVSSLGIDPIVRQMTLEYTIQMNQTTVPTTDRVSEEFPRGLGKSYAKYLYSGYAVLQRALNKFAARKTRQVAEQNNIVSKTGSSLSAIDLALSTCPGEGKYLQPDAQQAAVLSAMLSEQGPQITKIVVPTEEPSINALCLVETRLACNTEYESGSDEDLISCLQDYSSKSIVCADALAFVAQDSCLKDSYTCEGNITASQFLTGLGTSSPLTKCFSFNSTCSTTPFAQLYTNIIGTSADVCAFDVERYCNSYKDGAKCSWVPGSSCKGPLQCLQDQLAAKKELRTQCEQLVAAVPDCMDDLNSICPWGLTQSLSTFPALCLHLKRDYLSSSCHNTNYFTETLETFFANDAVITITNRTDATCHTATDLEAAFQDSIATVAMPANPYIQEPFFENVGPLVGLIVAIAFTVPFCAQVRRIVEDRFRDRRMYLLLIGGHHSAIIFADGFMGFLFLVLAAMVALLGLADFLFGSSKGMMFGILFTYAMALSSFGTFVAAVFNNPRTANSVAPMLLFLAALPAYITLADTAIFASLLPPAVAADSFNMVIQYSLTTSQVNYGYNISANCAILFAQWILYAALTILLEYLRFSEHGFGCFYNLIHSFKFFFSKSTRIVFRPLKRTAVYRQVSGRDYTGTRGRIDIREDDMEEGDQQLQTRDAEDYNDSGSVPLTDGHAIETPVSNRGDYSIGGIAAVNEQEAVGDSSSNEVHQRRSPASATRFVDLQDVSYTSHRVHHGRKTLTKDVSASLYRNRINVVIGPGGSGKSALMDVLSGKTVPTAGLCLIDDIEARYYNHQKVGVCLQSNITWDSLSVMEHLEFLQMIKGAPNNETSAAERLALCEALQLDASESLYADALPPGILRRLNVAMAFAGGSRYVVLDEPTTAVDENGRRCMWRLFNENAVGRCLVVSTTNVEEAEAAEHVLLMHKGTLKASGSPQFLKKHLGGGSMIVSVARGQHCNVGSLVSRVRACCPGAQLVNNVGQELSFRIAPSDFHSIPNLISDLEVASRENDIVSVSVADSRLDELFMLCVREFDATDGTAIPGSDGRFNESDAENSPIETNNAPSDYVSHESLSSGHAAPTPGTSTRHVKASGTVAVDPSWFRTVSVVGNDQERKHRRHGFQLIYRNTLSVIIQRLNGSMSELLATALEFILPLFCVMFAASILDSPVTDPPSLLLTPGLFRYSKTYFCTPDVGFRTWLNGQTFNGYMAPVKTDSWLGLSGTYTFTKTPLDGYNAVDMEGSFEVSYDLHSLAQFMGAYAFDDKFVSVKDPRTSLTRTWPASIVFQNTSTAHALPIYINVYDSIRTMRLTNFSSARIWGRTDPFAAGTTAKMAESRALNAIIGILLILVPFTFLPGVFALQVVGERESGVLAALTASRLSPVSYWIGTFIWHLLRYILFAVSALVCMTMGGTDSLLGSEVSTGDAFGLLFLYGCCCIAMAYGIGRFFKDALAAQTFITMTNFVCGIVCVVAMNAIDIMQDTARGETDAAKLGVSDRRYFFRIVPSYALGEGLLKVISAGLFNNNDNEGWLRHKVLNPMYEVLGITFPFYLAALILFDGVFRLWLIRFSWYLYSLVRDGCLVSFSSCLRTSTPMGTSGDPLKREPWCFDDRRAREGEDPSVEAERQKGPCPDGLSVSHLWRKYTGFGAEHNIYAVRGATLSVAPGDRLVVFGSNGSGKTTLIRMMAGVLMPSHGGVEIKSRQLQKSSLAQWRARSFTGYSENEAGVLASATPYMLLNLVADYRGMAPDGIREGHIGHLLHTLGLLPFFSTPIALLSPSLCRRVSVAMAIVGFPPVILLDEPTAGMDPVGRRMTWAALNLVPSKCAIVLSTHSIADVEMISNRVCLLQKGRVTFINEAQVAKQHANLKGMLLQIHLNVKGSSNLSAGLGGNIDLRVKNDVMEFVLRAFPGSILLEDRNNVDLKFHLFAEDISDTVFRQTTGPQTFGRKSTPPPPQQMPMRDLLDTGREEREEDVAPSIMSENHSPNLVPPQLPPTPTEVTMRDVFERVHQKRVELMLQGIYGDPISGPTSPTTKVNRTAQQRVVFQVDSSSTNQSSTPRQRDEDRHRHEIRDLLGGNDTTPSRPQSAPPQPTSVATELSNNATEEEQPSESATIMPFDIVITKSTIDQVLDKLIGTRGESAALERMFQNTSARIAVRDP